MAISVVSDNLNRWYVLCRAGSPFSYSCDSQNITFNHIAQRHTSPTCRLLGKCDPKDTAAKALHPYKESLPDAFHHFCAVQTFGSSTALCESSFSAHSQLQTSQRLSLSGPRLTDLFFIAFEYKHLWSCQSYSVYKPYKLSNSCDTNKNASK